VLRKLRADASGSSAIEFAILGPVFILMILGALTVGLAVNLAVSTQFALERVGRVFQLDPTMSDAAIKTALEDQLKSLNPPTLQVTVDRSVSANGLNFASIAVSYSVTLSVPFMAAFPYTYSTKAVLALNAPT
jgi:Flp pilus assembly protein TadG